MFTAYSACPDNNRPAPVPGTYQVLHPAPPEPVGRLAFRCRLSTATETARRLTTTPAPKAA